MSVIITGIYIIIVALLSVFVVHPLLTGKFLKSKSGNKSNPLNKKAEKLLKAKTLPLLIQWYVGIIIVGIGLFSILFIVENTFLPQYSFPALMNTLFNDPEKDEDDSYKWEFPDNPENNNVNNGTVVTSSEAKTVVQIALQEWQYYESNNIKGGDKYWQVVGPWYGWSSSSSWHWCAGFVNWVLVEAGVAGSSYDSTKTVPNITVASLGCETMKDRLLSGQLPGEWHKVTNGSTKTWTGFDGSTSYTPRPGDIAIYNDYKDAAFDHVGIVVEVTDTGEVWTVGGNEGGSGSGSDFYHSSKVMKRNRGIGALSGSYYKEVVFWTPPYKVTQTTIGGSGSTVVGNFDLAYYQKDANGYYSGTTTKQIVYDFLRLELGYNSAAAAGVMSNIVHESGFEYDKMEYANSGRAYVSKSTSAKYYQVPSPSMTGNGNWIGIPNIESTLQITSALYYYRSSKNDFIKYGMGFGLVQWSFGRRVAMFNYGEANGLGNGRGTDGLAAQLAYLKYELTEGSYQNTHNVLLNVEDSAQGAYDASYRWARYFEVCGGGEAAYVTRANEAKNTYWPAWGGKMPSAGVITNTGTSNSNISNVTMIGDSNTVRMYNYDTNIKKARNVFAIVGVSTGGWDTYTNASCTTGGKTLKSAIDGASTDSLANVVIMLGTNDFGNPGGISSNLEEIIQYIRDKNSAAKIGICTVPPVNDSYSSTITNAQATDVCTNIKNFVNTNSSKYNLYLIDVNSKLTTGDMSTATGDGYHLSKSGATKCADAIIAGLQ